MFKENKKGVVSKEDLHGLRRVILLLDEGSIDAIFPTFTQVVCQ